MATPSIGYQNLLETASVITVSSEAGGFESALAYNWRTFDGWKAAGAGGTDYFTVDLGSAQDVDYWGAAAHTLGTNTGQIQLQYSATGAWAGEEVNFDVQLSPSNNSALFQKVVTPISARYWRWEVSSSPASFFGVMSLGLSMELTRAAYQGTPLPRESRKNVIVNNRSEAGAFIGRSIVRKGFQSKLKLTLQSLVYARTTWPAFLDHAEIKPFFFSWNTDYDDAVFCWMMGDPTPASFDRHNTISMGIKLEGLL